MDTIAERNETIEDLNDHLEDGVRRFNLLEQELSDERDANTLLAQQIETYEIDCAKNKDSLDSSLELSRVLDASKKELEVAHASLTKDFEYLENAHKLLKGELITLKEKHEQLQATYEKSLGTPSDPIIVENVACATNSLLEQAILVQEIEKLKDQLEKERLDKVLETQKVRPPRQGLGFGVKQATPPKKMNNVQGTHKVDGNAKKNGEQGGAFEGNPNFKFAGKHNPSYVLCKGQGGYVYAKYVGPRNGYAYREYSIWVPKSLVTNAKEPITQWVPKQKT
jgi:hypothetical protein